MRLLIALIIAVSVAGCGGKDSPTTPSPSPKGQVFSRAGIGDTVFDMPTYVERVRIIGIYTGNSSNFIVRIGGRLLVNELLGTSWTATRYDGTLLTTGGVVEIVSSSGVSWSMMEQR